MIWPFGTYDLANDLAFWHIQGCNKHQCLPYGDPCVLLFFAYYLMTRAHHQTAMSTGFQLDFCRALMESIYIPPLILKKAAAIRWVMDGFGTSRKPTRWGKVQGKRGSCDNSQR